MITDLETFPLGEQPSSLCLVLRCELPVCLAVVLLKTLAGHGLCTLHALEVVSHLLGHSHTGSHLPTHMNMEEAVFCNLLTMSLQGFLHGMMNFLL